ncbi:hypothetical protein TNCV_3942191 [Trichonephila clavipes]|nr:hypothetical protein TNCV_3942191 [Trichonephila clavipes]
MAYAEKLAVSNDFDFQRHKGTKQMDHNEKSLRSHGCSDMSQTNSNYHTHLEEEYANYRKPPNGVNSTSQ